MKVAVIGGGWAGIAAAVELTAGGATTTLYEAGRVLGGRARSITIEGRTLDNGQHILLGAYRDTLDLMRQVGAAPEHPAPDDDGLMEGLQRAGGRPSLGCAASRDHPERGDRVVALVLVEPDHRFTFSLTRALPSSTESVIDIGSSTPMRARPVFFGSSDGEM